MGRTEKMNKACKASLEELEKGALEHYEKLASKSSEWLNVIPIAIKFYYKHLKKKREVKIKFKKSLCLDCFKEIEDETDIQLCQECMKNYDTERLWKLHDNNELDALDFNESPQMRERFRIRKKVKNTQEKANLVYRCRMEKILKLYKIPSYFYGHKKANGKISVKPIDKEKLNGPKTKATE